MYEGALQAEVKLNLVKNLFGSWTAFQKCSHSPVARLEQHIEQGAIDLVAVNMILQILEQLSQVVTSSGMSIEDIDLDPRCLTQRALELKSNIGQLGNAGHFEWVDGGLLKAVERGEWVVLENANFCNPTVCSVYL
jgi:midasin